MELASEVEEELEALRSIYANDFVEGPLVWKCPSCLIHCRPAGQILSKIEDNEIFASLRFTLTKGYPKTAPTIKIENYKGISKKEVAELDAIIQQTSRALVGNVMCYDVAYACTTFLEKCIPKSGNLYEDMLSRQNRERAVFQSIVEETTASVAVVAAHTPNDNARQNINRRTSITSEYSESDNEDEFITASTSKRNNKFSPAAYHAGDEDDGHDGEEDSSDDESESGSNSKGSDSDCEDDSDSKSSSSDSYSESEDSKADVSPIVAEIALPEIKSRYREEFEQMSLLGKGAFGEVWSCRNNLDTRVYAMKKVIINSSNMILNAKIRREVTTISHLWHKHIVRYYAAWVEAMTSADDDIHLAGESEEEDSLFASSNEVSSRHFSWTGENLDSSDDEVEDSDTLKLDSGSSRQVLYIQMEFCQTTLRAVLDEGKLWSQPVEVTRLLRQLTEALEYIHKQGIIHRDLKPANIFLDSNGNVKIGDFGLAIASKIGNDSESHEQSVGKATETPEASKEGLSGGVGTAAYRAPELESTSKLNYDGAVDMYCVGVILFEMCHPKFGTEMERISILNDLKERYRFPSGFLDGACALQFHEVIIQLIQKDPKRRPCATTLLLSKVFPPQIDPAYFAELTANLLQPNSETLQRVLDLLFDPPIVEADQEGSKDLDYDNSYLAQLRRLIEKDRNKEVDRQNFRKKHFVSKSAVRKIDPDFKQTYSQFGSHFQLQSHLEEYLHDVFKVFGAVHIVPAQFNVKEKIAYSSGGTSNSTISSSNSSSSLSSRGGVGKYGDATNSTYEFLDKSGAIVCLREDLTRTFARCAAILNLQSFRRFEFGLVYSSDSLDVDRGSLRHPRASRECVFEVVQLEQDQQQQRLSASCHSQSTLLACALQAMQVNTVVGDRMPLLSLRISDGRIFSSIFTAIFSDFSYDPTQTKSKTSNLKMSKLEAKKESDSNKSSSFVTFDYLLTESGDRDLLLRVLSSCSDSNSFSDFQNIWEGSFHSTIRWSSATIKRLQPFLQVLSSQCSFSEGQWTARDIALTLEDLEKEFYQIESVDRCRAYFARMTNNEQSASEEAIKLKTAIKIFHDAMVELKQTMKALELSHQRQGHKLSRSKASQRSSAPLIVFDLGLLPSDSSRLGHHCYDNDALFFVVEAYKSDGTEPATAKSPNNRPNHHSAHSHMDTKPVLRRHKQNGVVVIGGRFDGVFGSNAQHYLGSNAERYMAVGLTVRLDSMLGILIKSIEAHNKAAMDQAHNSKKQSVHGKGNPKDLRSDTNAGKRPFDMSRSTPDVLILESDVPDGKQMNPFPLTSYLLTQCRNVGLQAVEYVHQLQGLSDYYSYILSAASKQVSDADTARYSSHSMRPISLTEAEAISLCFDYNIPVLVLAESASSSCQIHFAMEGKLSRTDVPTDSFIATIVSRLLVKCPERLFRSAGLAALVSFDALIVGPDRRKDKAELQLQDGTIVAAPGPSHTGSNGAGVATGGNAGSNNTIGSNSNGGGSGGGSSGGNSAGATGANNNSSNNISSSSSCSSSSNSAIKLREVVHVLIDTPSTGRSFGGKDKDSDSKKHSRLRTKCEKYVAEYMRTLLQCTSIQLIGRSSGQGQLFKSCSPGTILVVSIDLPYFILRDIASIILRSCSIVTAKVTPASLLSAKDELQKLAHVIQSNDVVPNLRRLVKQLISEMSFVSSSSQATSTLEKDASSGPTSGNSGGSTLGNVNALNSNSNVGSSLGSGALVTVYLHSFPDDRFDVVQYAPEVLSKVVAAGATI